MSVGKWIVYESGLYNRWVAREIVGETEKFWTVQAYRPDGTCDDIEPRRKKKSSLGLHAVFDDGERANIFASSLTQELLDEDEKHKSTMREIKERHFERVKHEDS